MTFITASTAIGDNWDEYCETIFELREVVAAFKSESRSDKSILVAAAVKKSADFCDAPWKASAIVVG